MIKNAALIALVPVLTSCVPFPVVTTYYEPAAVGGVLASNYRGIAPAPLNVITFAAYGISTNVNSSRYGNRYECFVRIRVPAGKSVSFLSNKVEWWHQGMTGEPKKVPFARSIHYSATDARWLDFDPTSTTPGSDESGVMGQSANILVDVRFEDVEADRYFIRLPAIRIDSTVVDYPIIEFIRKRRTSIIYGLGG